MEPRKSKNEPSLKELFDLSGRVAIVTGACGHLGWTLSYALAEAGARVVVTSRDLERASLLEKSLPNPQKVEHIGAVLDQMDAGAIDRFITSVARETGRIDILVNNAHEPTTADWRAADAADFSRQLSNATAYFLLARHVRNIAVEHGRTASIVMVGSMYGVVGSYPDVYEGVPAASPTAYHVLKGGIVQLTRHLAVYWAKDHVRVNCLSPGPFPSSGANPQLVERLMTKSPMQRIGQPHELKGALVLLASDAGSYITGQNIIVDGGWTAW